LQFFFFERGTVNSISQVGCLPWFTKATFIITFEFLVEEMALRIWFMRIWLRYFKFEDIGMSHELG
jgi:hypothetical protein